MSFLLRADTIRQDILFSVLFHAALFTVISYVTFSRPVRFVEVSLSADVSTLPQSFKRTVPREKKISRKAKLWTPGEGVPLPEASPAAEKKFDFSPPKVSDEPRPELSGFEYKPDTPAPAPDRFLPDFGKEKGDGLQISGPVSRRGVMRRIYPEYPRAARMAGVSGDVVIKFWVSPAGVIDKTIVEETSGAEILDRAALDAVKKWLFAPLAQDEKQIRQWGRITVKFELK